MPAIHFEQEVTFPPAEYDPAAHAEGEDIAVLGQYPPGEQSEHAIEPESPLNVPAEQADCAVAAGVGT